MQITHSCTLQLSVRTVSLTTDRQRSSLALQGKASQRKAFARPICYINLTTGGPVAYRGSGRPSSEPRPRALPASIGPTSKHVSLYSMRSPHLSVVESGDSAPLLAHVTVPWETISGLKKLVEGLGACGNLDLRRRHATIPSSRSPNPSAGMVFQRWNTSTHYGFEC